MFLVATNCWLGPVMAEVLHVHVLRLAPSLVGHFFSELQSLPFLLFTASKKPFLYPLWNFEKKTKQCDLICI